MFPGRTYTLTDHEGGSSPYFSLVRELTDRFLETVPDGRVLRERIRNASSWKGILGPSAWSRRRVRGVLKELDRSLSSFLPGVEEHLRSLSLTERFDKTLRTRRDQYLLYMLEIEITNRINGKSFSKAPWRMALIAHCLRDFRDHCSSRPGDVEEQCTGCTEECCINLGSEILRRYEIHPYISASMDHRKLFRDLKAKHPDMGVVGIACIPELVTGMRLCEGMDIPVVGVPLDANRCPRWLDECLETTFSLEELERLMKPVPGTWN